jgi:polysaccharide deacetylase family protein (PEP-CTERM system associated)
VRPNETWKSQGTVLGQRREALVLDGCISVDVEDWFMGIEIDEKDWAPFADRLDTGLDRILSVLDDAGAKASFFILGYVAAKKPGSVRRIADAGHELCTHGWSHRKIYDLTEQQFREELRRSITAIQDATGQKVKGHRAPYFSITERSTWALPILEEAGIRFDSSIYPAHNYRYGIPGARREIHTVEGTQIVEFPISLMDLGPKHVGIGGAYLRILPLWLTAHGVRQNLSCGRPVNLYVHPWEFDVDHPHVKISPKLAERTHYWGLRSTEGKIRGLLGRFRFGKMSEVIAEAK